MEFTAYFIVIDPCFTEGSLQLGVFHQSQASNGEKYGYFNPLYFKLPKPKKWLPVVEGKFSAKLFYSLSSTYHKL